MNDLPALTARSRDDALRRLRRLTIVTAVAGSIATAAFGSLAAFGTAVPGTEATSDTTTAAVVDDDAGTAADSTTGATADLQVVPGPPSSTSGSAHVSSGGS
jgi:hypothetical protein